MAGELHEQINYYRPPFKLKIMKKTLPTSATSEIGIGAAVTTWFALMFVVAQFLV